MGRGRTDKDEAQSMRYRACEIAKIISEKRRKSGGWEGVRSRALALGKSACLDRIREIPKGESGGEKKRRVAYMREKRARAHAPRSGKKGTAPRLHRQRMRKGLKIYLERGKSERRANRNFSS